MSNKGQLRNEEIAPVFCKGLECLEILTNDLLLDESYKSLSSLYRSKFNDHLNDEKHKTLNLLLNRVKRLTEGRQMMMDCLELVFERRIKIK